jgi:hypothetical protein
MFGVCAKCTTTVGNVALTSTSVRSAGVSLSQRDSGSTLTTAAIMTAGSGRRVETRTGTDSFSFIPQTYPRSEQSWPRDSHMSWQTVRFFVGRFTDATIHRAVTRDTSMTAPRQTTHETRWPLGLPQCFVPTIPGREVSGTDWQSSPKKAFVLFVVGMRPVMLLSSSLPMHSVSPNPKSVMSSIEEPGDTCRKGHL